MGVAKTKSIHVTDVQIDTLKQARELAVADGVTRTDAAVLRYALSQFVKVRNEQTTGILVGQGCCDNGDSD